MNRKIYSNNVKENILCRYEILSALYVGLQELITE